ncbi:hypothetical protein Acsp02_97550 [Actinoplanes sp. NBRC 103695]|nr:hypothetical protein Acsp02_97550 [Actinoplanes sp. NBRC 103695]
MIGADVHPAGVRGDVIDAVGHGLTDAVAVMGVDPGRVTGRTPFPAGVLEVPQKFLLLGVDADHRLPAVTVDTGLLVEILELPVTVGMLFAFQGLGVALQAETVCP